MSFDERKQVVLKSIKERLLYDVTKLHDNLTYIFEDEPARFINDVTQFANQIVRFGFMQDAERERLLDSFCPTRHLKAH